VAEVLHLPIVLRRSVSRHERGTLLVLIALMIIPNILIAGALFYVVNSGRELATPDIVRAVPADVRWGPHIDRTDRETPEKRAAR
jgi:hypothetical protein